MRANRELILSNAFCNRKDPRHRWWGIQVEFDPGGMLDLSSNNKQNAENLISVAGKQWEDYAEEGETDTVKERFKKEDYESYVCIDIAHQVNDQIAKMFKTIKKTSKAPKKKKRHDDSPERIGTEATKKRVQDTGKETETDHENEELSKEQRMEKISKFLTDMTLDADEVNENLGDIMDSGLKYSINHGYLESDAFFSVDGVGGAIFITLNRKHSTYKELFDTLDERHFLFNPLRNAPSSSSLSITNDYAHCMVKVGRRIFRK